MAARRNRPLIVPLEEEEPLTPDELRLQRRLFNGTQSFPDGYRKWLPDFAALNSPQLPASLVTGARSGIWQAWTPSWTASANPAIGDGTLVGRYAINGQVVTACINLTAGSTTTFGTGDWAFSLPTQIAASFVYPVYGRAVDSGVTGRYAVAGTVDSTNNLVLFDGTTGPGSRLSATVPFTWASGDLLQVTAIYEILR